MTQLGGDHCTTRQDMVSLSSSSQFSIDAVFPNRGSKLLTDDQICTTIYEKIATFRSSSANESGLSHKRVIGSLFQADCNVPLSSSNVIPKRTHSLAVCLYKQNVNSAAIQQCNPKATQAPEDLLKIIKAELTSKNIETKDCPHVQREVAATSVTKEVLSTISAGTSKEETETCPGLTRSCSLSQEEHKSQLNSNKSLDNGDLMPDVSVELQVQKTEKNPGINKVEEMDSAQDINSNTTENQQDPQYEDISDDEDKSELLISELYEDVSDDETQCDQKFAVVTPPHPLSESTPGNSRSGLDVVEMKNLIPETETRCCCSPLVQTEHQTCFKGDHEPNASCAVFADKKEFDNQLDDNDDYVDDDDDNWTVVPITILNLKFEEADDGECGVKTSSSFINERLGSPAPKPVPASAFSQMEVFDTPAQQEQAVRFGQVSFVDPSSSNHQQESHIIVGRQEAEDICEPNDCCDYSSGSESNYLTASNHKARNLSSPSEIIVDSDSERKNQGYQAKNLQKSFNQDIVYIDSDDESEDDCVKGTKTWSPLPEICGSSPANKPETLKNLCEKMPPGLDPARPQLQGGHTEPSKLSQGTEKGFCVINEDSTPTNSDDDIIILSDSDDDSLELSVEAMTSTLNSLNSDFWLKEHTAEKEILQDLNQFSAESSSGDKPGTSRLTSPAKLSFHEPSREVKVLTKRKMSEMEEEDDDDGDDDDAGNGVCTKRKKAKLLKASVSLGPVIPRLLVQVSPLSRDHIQLVHKSTVQSQNKDLLPSNSSSVSSQSDSFRKKSQHAIRDEPEKLTSKSKRTKRDHNPTQFKVSQASSLKGQVPYSRPPASCLPLKRSSSSSANTQSEAQTNHARRKVFSDWQKNHVPLRKERKATRRGNLP